MDIVFTFCIFISCFALLLLSTTATESNWSDGALQNIYHPPPPPSLPALNEGPPILCLTLSDSLPHSLSPPSFSLTASPRTLTASSNKSWRIFTYLPVAAEGPRRRGEKINSSPSFKSWLFSHGTGSRCLCLTLRWVSSGFPHGIRMTTAAFLCHQLSSVNFSMQLFAKTTCKLWWWSIFERNFSTLNLRLLFFPTSMD